MTKNYIILGLSLLTSNIIKTFNLNNITNKIIRNIKTTGNKVTETAKTAGHWGLSAGPVWLEAYNYLALLSEPQALSIFGNQDVTNLIDKEIRNYLKEINFINFGKVKIKFIKPEMQKYIVSAIICTDNIIFINPEYYNILNIEEKKALIVRTAILIEAKYLRQSAIILSLIPIITHCTVKGYERTAQALLNILPDSLKDSWLNKIISGHTYVIGSWLGKLAISTVLSSLYFKYQSLINDLKTIQKIKSVKPLLSYYSKIKEKQMTDDFLLNIIKIPDNKKEQYLKRLVKLNF